MGALAQVSGGRPPQFPMISRTAKTVVTCADVPGVRNFRDAGGVGSLRRGALYRSGALHALSPEGARVLKDLRLRTVIDLRARTEMTERPDRCKGNLVQVDLRQARLEVQR
ncbi:tyrosine-protein phosphatase [Micromonospora peucetia]|nr:tyrosine-protein phosphatase [Micromonospora peucetia]